MTICMRKSCVGPKTLSVFVFASFPFGFEGGLWELIVLFPDHCLFLLYRVQIIALWFCNGSTQLLRSFHYRE